MGNRLLWWSDDLEVTRQLPVADVLAELALFPLASRCVMFDERVAEEFPRDFRGLETLSRVPQRAWQRETSGELAVVRVAGHCGLGLDLVLDAPEARAERGREDHVRIRVRGRDPEFHALRLC